MGKGYLLSESKKAVILLMKKEKKSINKISKEINRSRGVVSKFLKDPIKYGKIKSPGRPRALSLRTRARVVRLAKGKNITASKIIAQLNLKVNKSTVLRVIKNDGKLSRRRIKRKPIFKKKS